MIVTGWLLGLMAGIGAPPVVAEVRNASGRPGLARLVTRLLREKGVDVVYFGNASEVVDSTSVLVRRGPVDAGQAVGRLLGVRRVAPAADPRPRVDVTVLIGKDYRFPKERLPL